MATFEFIASAETTQWHDALAHLPGRDFYFTPAYHELGEGEARLFVYRDGGESLVLPLLLRPFAKEPWAHLVPHAWGDATSVYGYAGPLASQANLSSAFLRGFRETLTRALSDLGIVSLFARLHPLIPEQRDWLAGLGETPHIGVTVSIDTTLSAEAREAQMKRSHRLEIRRLTKTGWTFRIDESLEKLDDFVRIYHENMVRVGARPEYFFAPDYFRRLCRDRARVKLGLVENDGAIGCAGLILVGSEFGQYHLSGSADAVGSLPLTKLLVSSLAEWANRAGLRRFHLGGGLGGCEDALFEFKARFSPLRHDFHVWRWIVRPDDYNSLIDQSLLAGPDSPLETAGAYFPAYRHPSLRWEEP